MPQNLTVHDYTFYLTKDPDGLYRFGKLVGNVCRRPKDEFEKMVSKLSAKDQKSIIRLFAIASVEDIQTGEHDLVFHLFEDLREN